MTDEKKFFGTTICPLFQKDGEGGHSVFLNSEMYESFQEAVKAVRPGGILKVKFASKGKPSAYLEFLSTDDLEQIKARQEARSENTDDGASDSL